MFGKEEEENEKKPAAVDGGRAGAGADVVEGAMAIAGVETEVPKGTAQAGSAASEALHE
jgi:hypothetical protein